MDFDKFKISHLFALLMLLGSIFLFIGSPIMSVLSGETISTQIEQISDFDESFKIIFEIISVTLEIIMFIIFMILVPIIWYMVVNKLTFKESLNKLKLKIQGIDKAILWGILGLFFMFAIVTIIGIILTVMGVNVNDIGNIEDISMIFSVPAMFIIITTQPIGEEIFFRGFLLDKIDSLFKNKTTFISENKLPAILITSILFGIAHLAYGKIYPVVMTIIIGLILGFIVVRSKNLYSSIIAHICFNVLSFIIFLIGTKILGV